MNKNNKISNIINNNFSQNTNIQFYKKEFIKKVVKQINEIEKSIEKLEQI